MPSKEQLDQLLNQNWVEDFLTKYSKNIFGQSGSVKVRKVDRSNSFAPESYPMRYQIEINGQQKNIRAVASLLESREQSYIINKYLFDHGFNSGPVRVSKPLSYFHQLNLFFYEEAPGKILMDFIGEHDPILEDKIVTCAKALKKIHQTNQPSVNLEPRKWFYDEKVILSYDSRINKKVFIQAADDNDVIRTYKGQFCHGDFQPNNIVFGNEQLYIIDFGSATLAAKELDVASFTAQLEVMLRRRYETASPEKYVQKFLMEYGEYDQEKYQQYYRLFLLNILNAMISYYNHAPAADLNKLRLTINGWAEKINQISL